MKKLVCAWFLLLLTAGNALAENPAKIQTEVLAKSQMSWDIWGITNWLHL